MTDQTSDDGKLPIGVKLGYGVADITFNIYFIATAALLQPMMTGPYAIPAAIAGVALSITKLVDIVVDPMIGSITDRINTRWGRRRPWVLFGGLAFIVAFWVLFNAPVMESWEASLAFILVAFIVSAITYAFATVPYGAMTAEMTTNFSERTSITSFRMASASVGILAGSAIGNQLVQNGGGGAAGYSYMATILSLFMIIPLVICFFSTAKTRIVVVETVHLSIVEQLKIAAKNKPFLILVCSFILQFMAMGILTGAMKYAIDFVLQPENPAMLFTIAMGSMIGVSIIAMPLWVFLAGKLGKKQAYMLGGIIYSLLLCCMIFIGKGQDMVLVGLSVLIGIVNPSFQLLPWSMLPDCMDYDELNSGQRREGMFNGLWVALQKTAMAVAPAVIGIVLQMGDFISGDVKEQPESAQFAIRLVVSIVPALIFLSSFLILRKYDLDEAKHKEILATLAARKKVA